MVTIVLKTAPLLQLCDVSQVTIVLRVLLIHTWFVHPEAIVLWVLHFRLHVSLGLIRIKRALLHVQLVQRVAIATALSALINRNLVHKVTIVLQEQVSTGSLVVLVHTEISLDLLTQLNAHLVPVAYIAVSQACLIRMAIVLQVITVPRDRLIAMAQPTRQQLLMFVQWARIVLIVLQFRFHVHRVRTRLGMA